MTVKLIKNHRFHESGRMTEVVLILFLTLLAFSVHGVNLPEEPEQTRAARYPDIVQGEMTASSEEYDENLLSCAHPTLPFGTVLRVENQETGRIVTVKVNDRISKKLGEIHLSEVAADSLGLESGKKASVVATAMGVTTAQIVPRSSSFQNDAIPVAIGGEAEEENSVPFAFLSKDEADEHQDLKNPMWRGEENPTGPMLAMQQEIIPVNLISPEALEQFPPLILEDKDNGEAPMAAISRTLVNMPYSHKRDVIPLPSKKAAIPTAPLKPVRAQFGAFVDAAKAINLTNELNAIGFRTFIVQSGRIHCVVTIDIFDNIDIAADWADQVETLHHRKLAVVRL